MFLIKSHNTQIWLVACFITFANNQVLIGELQQRIDWNNWQSFLFVLSLFLLIIIILVLIFSCLDFPLLIRPLLTGFIISSALFSYFNQAFGVVFDTDMIRNIGETIKDNNLQEAEELLSIPLLIHLSLYGLLPSFLLLKFPHHYSSFFKEIKMRLSFIFIAIILCLTLILLNYKYVAFFSRENRDLRFFITPVYPMLSLAKLLRQQIKQQHIPFKIIGEDAIQTKTSETRKKVGILIVGETARADHFSVNGYSRQTNPKLSKIKQLISYSNMQACGTSTAFSVPCLFAFLSRENYSPNKADKQSNVLDVLSYAGIKVVWIDNNSSCKGVCKRIDNVNLRENPDPQSPFYAQGQYYDEILLKDLDRYIEKSKKDVLIVLHSLGSHGPSYYKRYPKKFAQFSPDCHKDAPQSCTKKQIINTYDNTILYTDHLLAKTIFYLKRQNLNYDSFMLYVSDHGESLGENGIFLHGLPYFLAPQAQLHIPLIAWFSSGFQKTKNWDIELLQHKRKNSYSHDNISHSLLGLYNISTNLYQTELDIFKTAFNYK